MRRKIGSVLLAASILLVLIPDTAMAVGTEGKPATAAVGEASLDQTKTDGDADRSVDRGASEDTAALLEGSGSETDPYRIQDAGQLRIFADMVNGVGGAADAGICAVLTKNIDLSGVCGGGIGSWTPIGTKTRPYTGVFDGASFAVRGLYYSSPGASNAGLFGYNSGVIKNLGVAGDVAAGNYAGGVCGCNKGTITGCYSAVSVNGGRYTGGICGYNDGGSVSVCYHTGAVSGSKYVGGISGYNKNMVADCYNTGMVDGSSTSVGGICGYNRETVSNCYNTGAVSGKGTDYIGSICGYNYSGSVFLNSYYLVTGTEIGNYGMAMTREQFKSGEVCWLLNGGTSEGVVWHQTCGAGLPGFGGKTVYQAQAYRGSGDTQELVSWYTNDANESGLQTDSAWEEETSGDSAHEHVYQEPEWSWKGYREAVAVLTCQDCGAQTTLEASIGKKTTAATCAAEGKTVYTASVNVDEKTYQNTKTVMIAKTGHRPFEPVTVTPATCEKPGFEINCWTCPACKQYFKDKEGTAGLTKNEVEEPALGHNYVKGEWVWAADYSKASIDFSCQRCGKTETKKGSVKRQTTASCTEPGKTTYTATVKYNKQEYKEVKEVAGETLPHKYSGKPKWTWSGLEYDGNPAATASFSCAYGCGTIVEINGDLQCKSTDATCKAAGKATYTATVTYNEKAYKDTKKVEGKKVPHDYSGEPKWNWSKDKRTATAVFSCSYGCGNTVKEPGDVQFKTENATCTVPGDTVYTATVKYNEREYQETKTENGQTIPHAYGGTPTWKWPEAGSDEEPAVFAVFSCVYGCGDTKDVEASIIKSNPKKEATCKEPGETVYTAAVHYEGKDYTETSDPIVGKTVPHKYSNKPTEWKWSGPESESGEDITVVAVFGCDYGCGETIDVAGEVEQSEVVKEATCKEPGKAIYTASVVDSNGKEYEYDGKPIEGAIPRGDHTMEHFPAEDETCTKQGKREYWQCSACGKLFGDEEGSEELAEEDTVVPMKAHVFEHVEGTTYRCTECKKMFTVTEQADGTTAMYSLDEGTVLIQEVEENDISVGQSAEAEKNDEEAAADDSSTGSALEESQKDGGSLPVGEQTGEGGQGEQVNQETQGGQTEQAGQTETAEQEEQAGQTETAEQEEQAGQTETAEQEEQAEQTETEEQNEQLENESEGDAVDNLEENAHYGLVYPAEETHKADSMILDAQEGNAVSLRAEAAANGMVQKEQEQMERSLGIWVIALAAFTGMLLILILRKKES